MGNSECGLSPEERDILTETARRMEEIAARKPPPKWQWWAVKELDVLRRHGPLYSPSQWFGDGQPVPERIRVKYLRAVHALADAGLLERAGTGGRLQSIKLTKEGQRVADELMGTPKKAEKVAAKKSSKKAPPSGEPAPATAAGREIPPLPAVDEATLAQPEEMPGEVASGE